MKLDQLIAYAIGLAILAGPIALLVLIDKRPQRLLLIRKLTVSLALIGVGFATPLLIPGVLTGLHPVAPLTVALVCPLSVVPQGFVGAALASALLAMKLSPQATRDANHLWWLASLGGVIWSATAVLSLGVAFADW